MYFTHRSRSLRALSGTLALAVVFGITPVAAIHAADAGESLATLHVVTEVINSHGGTNTPSDFIISIVGAGASSPFFAADADPRVVSIDPDTQYDVLVSAGSRYSATRSVECSGVIATGGSATCHILLNDNELYDAAGANANRIPNGALEASDAADPTVPAGWSRGWPWGVNIASYDYPVAVGTDPLISSGSAMSISYASYDGDVLSGGDAKWYTAPVPVTAGHRYLYQDAYSANTATYIVAEFFDAAQQHLSNAGYDLVPPTVSGAWMTASASFVVPAGAAYMSVYHQLNSIGTLTLDNVSLNEIALPKQFERGLVSLAFDDGYISHFSNAKTVLNGSGLKGTFYAVSHISGLGVVNPSFELPDVVDAGQPLGWFPSGGNDSVLAYPVDGRTGLAARLTTTNPESGAGWSMAPVTVFANQSHEFRHHYKSTAESSVTIQVAKTDGTLAYMQSDGGLVSAPVAYATLPSSNDWVSYSTGGLWIPPESKSVSVRYGLVASGTLDIDDVNMGAYLDFMTPDQLHELQAQGHEIGGHTETHASLTALPLEQALKEMGGSRLDFLSGGLTPVVSFAYPLGESNAVIQGSILGAGYTSARGTVPGFNGMDGNRFALASTMIMDGTTLEDIRQLINEAVADRSWLILTFHQILSTDAVGRTLYTTTPERLEGIVNYLTTNNVSVRTVAEVAALMDGGSMIPAPTPPTTSSSAVSSGSTSSGGGSSTFSYWGCIDPAATNFNRLANVDDNSCILPHVATTTMATTLAVTELLTSEPLALATSTPADTALGEVLGASVRAHMFNVPLRRGSRGSDVTELQRRLSESGHFTGPITGYFGKLTFAAVKKFQLTHKIDPIGLVGPKTRGALNASVDSVVITSVSSGVSFESAKI